MTSFLANLTRTLKFKTLTTILSLLVCIVFSNIGHSYAGRAPVVRGTWQGNKTILINTRKVAVPSYLPFAGNKPQKYHWSTDPAEAYSPNFWINFSTVGNCNGEHACNFGSFATYTLPYDSLSFFQMILASKFEPIVLDPFVVGYYIPSKC